MSENPAEPDNTVPDLNVSSESESDIGTVRLNLNLEPLENGYAEFNYRELITAAYESEKMDLDETSTHSSSRSSIKLFDDVLPHMKAFGYDTTDPFIDDTELFDEYTPSIPGGFYIHLKLSKCQPPTTALPSNSSREIVIEGDKKNSDVKENKIAKKRKAPLLVSENIESKKPKKVNTRNEIEIIGEVIRRPFSIHQNSSYVKNIAIKCPSKAGDRPKLPPALPESLLRSLELLKESAVTSRVSKLGLFNERTKKLFIDFELRLLPFSIKVRSDIYLYLSSYFSLSAATLKKKSKMLIVQKLTDEINEAIVKLANEIQKSEHPTASQQNGDHDVCQMKVDFLPAEKEFLLLIFRLRKKLFEVQRVKTRDFWHQLSEMLQEDIVHMWLPSQMNIESLLGLASEFYSKECVHPICRNLPGKRQNNNLMSDEKLA